MRRAGAGPRAALACLAACLVTSQVLVACSTAEPSPSAPPATASAERSSPGEGSSPSTTRAPTPGGASAGATEPLVLVRHATLPRPRMGEERARRLLSRRDPAASPAEVMARVHRRPGRIGVLPASAVDATVRTAIVAGVDPLREPGRYPFQVAGPAPPERAVVLAVTGDVMLARGVTEPRSALAPMAPRLRGADLAVGNLESTLSTDGPPQQGGDSFGTGPGTVDVVARAGFDAMSLANNHTGDYGPRALLETVSVLRDSAVRPFGAGRSRRDAARPAVLTRHGVRFGFLAFNAIGETPVASRRGAGAVSVRMPPRTGPLHRGDLRAVLRDVRRLEARVDVVVVLPHWGTQYTHEPVPEQRFVGRRLSRAGADLVVGGHPHWVQGIDWSAGVPVLHSLGNFVFDMDFMVETQQGVLLEATFWGERLVALDLVPYRMDDAFAPRPAGPREAAQILADVWSTSSGPFAGR